MERRNARFEKYACSEEAWCAGARVDARLDRGRKLALLAACGLMMAHDEVRPPAPRQRAALAAVPGSVHRAIGPANTILPNTPRSSCLAFACFKKSTGTFWLGGLRLRCPLPARRQPGRAVMITRHGKNGKNAKTSRRTSWKKRSKRKYGSSRSRRL